MDHGVARMVPVKTCLSLPEALVAGSYLQGHGIFAALNAYHHASAAWHCLFALNGIQISVLDIDADRARQLLQECASKGRGREQASTEDGKRPTPSEILIAAAGYLLTCLPLPAWVRRRRAEMN